jgi:hypothetical protein
MCIPPIASYLPERRREKAIQELTLFRDEMPHFRDEMPQTASSLG